MNPRDYQEMIDKGMLSFVRFPTLHSILAVTGKILYTPVVRLPEHQPMNDVVLLLDERVDHNILPSDYLWNDETRN